MPSKLCHVNIPATDLGKSQQFYGELFGWTFTPNTDSYVLFDDGGMGGGLTTDSQPVAEGGTLLFIEVEDIEAKLSAIEAAGGSVILRKTPVGGPGFYAVFTDPPGNRMGLYSRT